MKTAFLLFLSGLVLIPMLKAQNEKEDKFKMVYSQGFSNDKSTKDFEFSDADKWLISKNGKTGKSLKCLGQGQYNNVHEGPTVVAVLKQYELTEFVLEMDIQQNGKNYDLLDFCVFFGVTDKDHYTYAQIAAKSDKNRHNIFSVNGNKPQRIGKNLNEGVIWGINKWHHIKIERLKDEKTVKVYFNDELILESDNETCVPGLIGFGSSSSALKVDNLKISAPEYSETETQIFN